MDANLDKLYEYAISYGGRIIFALLIFIVGKWVANLLAKIVEKNLTYTKLNKTLTVFIKNIVYYGLFIFVAVAALNKLGVETTSFAVLLGAAGLAIGLALQGSLANFAAGVMIIIFQPFEVGDQIEAAGSTGIVTEIQIFNTILSADGDKKVIIPNAKITGDKVVVSKKR